MQQVANHVVIVGAIFRFVLKLGEFTLDYYYYDDYYQLETVHVSQNSENKMNKVICHSS